VLTHRQRHQRHQAIGFSLSVCTADFGHWLAHPSEFSSINLAQVSRVVQGHGFKHQMCTTQAPSNSAKMRTLHTLMDNRLVLLFFGHLGVLSSSNHSRNWCVLVWIKAIICGCSSRAVFGMPIKMCPLITHPRCLLFLSLRWNELEQKAISICTTQ
jgi:hypothetical protein